MKMPWPEACSLVTGGVQVGAAAWPDGEWAIRWLRKVKRMLDQWRKERSPV